jgi:hypothetical protein
MFYVMVDEKLYVAVTERGVNSYIGGDRALRKSGSLRYKRD